MNPDSNFKIGHKTIGPSNPTYIIAEVGQAHEGSLGLAHSFIDAAANAGADAIKFQTHIAHAETTRQEPWRVKFSKQDATRWDYWKRMEFSHQQWEGLIEHAREKSIEFLSSPFSFEAVDLLNSIGIEAWKIASGEVSNIPLLKKITSTGKPVLISSGLSDWQEIDTAVEFLKSEGVQVGLFQCTTAYPCPAEKVGLNLIAEMMARYNLPIGLSDHSSKIYSGLGAVALGASMVEVHVAFSREMFGPDTLASLTFDELKKLREGCDFICQSTSNPISKERLSAEQINLRAIFNKSVYLKNTLPAGSILKEKDLVFKKPGTGIPVSKWESIVGRKLILKTSSEQPLKEADLI